MGISGEEGTPRNIPGEESKLGITKGEKSVFVGVGAWSHKK